MEQAAPRTSWTVSVSKETDAAVRGFLSEHGMEQAELSRFIEEAVKWRVLDRTLADARSNFADLAPGELAAAIDEAVSAVRRMTGPDAWRRWRKRRWRQLAPRPTTVPTAG